MMGHLFITFSYSTGARGSSGANKPTNKFSNAFQFFSLLHHTSLMTFFSNMSFIVYAKLPYMREMISSTLLHFLE